jgi:hypothetical protein
MQQSLLKRLAEYTLLVQLQERHNKTETLLSCEVQTDRGVRVMRGHGTCEESLPLISNPKTVGPTRAGLPGNWWLT